MTSELEDIKNCYRTIFSIQKGTVIHNPNLGWNIREYLSKPINEMLPKIKVGLIKDLNYQEQRATVLDVEFNTANAVKGVASAKLIVAYKDETIVVEVG